MQQMIDLEKLMQNIRITAGHSAPVLLMPAEALALVAEVERLNNLIAETNAASADSAIRWAQESREAYRQRDAATIEERAAVVAYLRELGAINSMLSPMKGAADDIERGEHHEENE
jgi:cbb3-type cytochrome oxidase cytochrome c subunit